MQVSSTVWFYFPALQDGAPAHTAQLAQDWIATSCSEFTGKAEWPSNSLDVSPLDCYVWGVNILEHYKTFHTEPKNTDGLESEESLAVNMKPAAAGINHQGTWAPGGRGKGGSCPCPPPPWKIEKGGKYA